ncbi:MAG: hypothetical protein M3P39_08065 [Actinomycetota bacterium]|nr:hypothetical protein [Actinomycetota bacterium]
MGASLSPDHGDPVVGFREWVLLDDELLSPLARTPWGAETMQAECLARCRRAAGLWRSASPHPGPAPDPRCVCGLYAFAHPYAQRDHGRLTVVRGAVALWGRVEVHERGMRAEFARVLALALPGGRRPEAAVRRVAERLEVPAVAAKHLPAAALAHGQALPSSLIPT